MKVENSFEISITKSVTFSTNTIRCSVTAITSRSHRGDRGSTPRFGIYFCTTGAAKSLSTISHSRLARKSIFLRCPIEGQIYWDHCLHLNLMSSLFKAYFGGFIKETVGLFLSSTHTFTKEFNILLVGDKRNEFHVAILLQLHDCCFK